MSEALPIPEPVNPGSLADYIIERSHPAVGITEYELRKEWESKLSNYRIGLAAIRGVSLAELHEGRGITEPKDSDTNDNI